MRLSFQEKDVLAPCDILALGAFFSKMQGTVVLLTGGSDEGSKHFIHLFPYASFVIDRSIPKLFPQVKAQLIRLKDRENGWQALQKKMAFSSSKKNKNPSWIGYIGYEFGFDSDDECIIPYYPGEIPQCYFQKCAIVLEAGKGYWRVFVEDEAISFLVEDQKAWVEKLQHPPSWYTLLQKRRKKQKNQTLHLHFRETKERYLQKVSLIKEKILAGDVYQVNLSQQVDAIGSYDSYLFFEDLYRHNPSPFFSFLQLGRFSIVSSSPERFLCKKGCKLETRPIKGTIARGRDTQEDERFKQRLLSSEKDRAELLMITDLLRNDLAKISNPKSIEVQEFARIEAYSNVYHLVSIITSLVDKNLHPITILRNLFPGGSITGCPKLASQRMIASLEKRARQIYTGIIGYFYEDGDFDFSIAIRTVIAQKNRITIQLGGAIVADSDPEHEYLETLDKGKTIFSALNNSNQELLYESALL